MRIGIGCEAMLMNKQFFKSRQLSPRDSCDNYIGRMLPLPEAASAETEGRFKLVVVGDSDAGKTCLLNTYVKEEFEVEDAPWLFDEAVVDVSIQGRELEFSLWDLSGLDDYDGFRMAIYDDTDIFLICFDIGNPNSIENVESKWIPEIRLERPNTPFILVGCKNDLRSDSSMEYFLTVPDADDESELSCVSRIRAERLALETGAKDYVECCAKTRFNIKEVFRTAAEVVLQRNDPMYNAQAKGLFGFRGLGKYARRKSAEIGIKLNSTTRFFPDKTAGLRRGSMF